MKKRRWNSYSGYEGNKEREEDFNKTINDLFEFIIGMGRSL